MNTERKPSITELIEALELHLAPRTDPDHCDPCPYNNADVGDDAHDVPQNLCEYKLMQACLETLKQQKTQITMLEHSTIAAVKDFIEYFIDCSLPARYAGTDEDYIIGETAFNLGAAFTKWQQFLEE